MWYMRINRRDIHKLQVNNKITLLGNILVGTGVPSVASS